MNISKAAFIFSFVLALGVLLSTPLKLDVKAMTSPISLYITGRVRVISAPLSGVRVRLISPVADFADVKTDANGVYRFNIAVPGRYTVRPYLPGYVFRPVSRTVQVTDTPVTGQDFQAVRLEDKFTKIVEDQESK